MVIFDNLLLHSAAPRPRPPPDGSERPSHSARPPPDERRVGPWSISNEPPVGARAPRAYPADPESRAARTRADRALLERAHRGDQPAREQLVQRFLPLARQLARRYQRGGEPLDDLIQVASLGLLKAIDRFDPSRETAFSSFAVPTILGELKRHFRDKGWSVRVPRDLQELAVKLEPVSEELARELGRAADARARSPSALGVTLEQVLEAREAAGAYRAVSLDRPRDDDEDGDGIGAAFGIEDPGFGEAEDAATVAAPDAGPERARARGAAAALRGGPHAGRDRRRASASRRCTSRASSARRSCACAKPPS